ncbi:hypothetical protein EVAR_48723_1, partial [Eumeta japonica]
IKSWIYANVSVSRARAVHGAVHNAAVGYGVHLRALPTPRRRRPRLAKLT